MDRGLGRRRCRPVVTNLHQRARVVLLFPVLHLRPQFKGVVYRDLRPVGSWVGTSSSIHL